MLCWFPALLFHIILVGSRKSRERNLSKASRAIMLTYLGNFKIDEIHELKEFSKSAKLSG
jgi:hypothetical protein